MGTEGSADTEQQDVVIIGGGVSGLYCAWRLLNNDPSQKIIVLEQLNRIGGRLDSDLVVIDDVPVKEEEGGMRFLDSQTLLWNLLGKLGLDDQIVPFFMGDENNIFYLRGNKPFTRREASDNKIWSKIYNLRPKEQDKSPDKIINDVISTILTKNGFDPKGWYPSSPQDWQKFRLELEYDGIKIFKWGFWSLLSEYGLSQECITMLHNIMGFVGPFARMVNAGAGFQLFGDFTIPPQFKTLRLGYETLPKTLEKNIIELGGDIRKNYNVKSFQPSGNGFEVVTGTQESDVKRLKCSKLILALPTASLKLLTPSFRLLGSSIQYKIFLEDLNGVIPMFLTKINLYYEKRWWYTHFHIKNGGSFTDLPLNSVYCFDPLDRADQKGPAALTIYCGYYQTNYWQELQSIGKPYYTDKFPKDKYLSHVVPASTKVVEQAQKQLAEMYRKDDNKIEIPHPVLATYKRWSISGIGDAFHLWAVGANDKEITDRLWNPFKKEGLYICGEAYSDVQGWVEGALRSSERILQSGFGLSSP